MAAWLLVAIPYVALVVFVVSPRADLISKASEWRYVIEQLAALATGITAATAAFATVIPGYDRKFLFLPALPLAIWLATLGEGCVQDWIYFGPDGLSLRPDWFCFPAIVLVGAVPAIAMAVMLLPGAPLSAPIKRRPGRPRGGRTRQFRAAAVSFAGCEPDGSCLAGRHRVYPHGDGRMGRTPSAELAFDRRHQLQERAHPIIKYDKERHHAQVTRADCCRC